MADLCTFTVQLATKTVSKASIFETQANINHHNFFTLEKKKSAGVSVRLPHCKKTTQQYETKGCAAVVSTSLNFGVVEKSDHWTKNLSPYVFKGVATFRLLKFEQMVLHEDGDINNCGV